MVDVKRAPVIIRNAADLARLMTWPRPTQVQLDLPGKPAPEIAIWQSRLVTSLSACGCTEGAIGLIAGLAVALIVWMLGMLPGQGAWITAAIFLAVAVIGALIGKGIGRLRARRALQIQIAALRRWIDAG